MASSHCRNRWSEHHGGMLCCGKGLEKSSASCHREVLQESIPRSGVLWVSEAYLWAGLSRSLWSLEGLLEMMIWAAAVKLSLPSGRHCLPWLWSAAWAWRLKPFTGCMCTFSSWLQQAGLKIHGGPTSFAWSVVSR